MSRFKLVLQSFGGYKALLKAALKTIIIGT